MSSSIGFDSPLLYSPQYSPPDQHSPWSLASPFDSEPSAYDSLTLPPINPDGADNNLGDLPSYDFFAALPPLGEAFLPSARSQERDAEQEPHASTSHTQTQPQQHSQLRITGSASPDIFAAEDYIATFNRFLDVGALPHSPTPTPRMPPSRPTTQRSSIVDLTATSSPESKMAPATRKRKATEEPSSNKRAPKKAARIKASESEAESSSPSRRTSLAGVEVVDLAEVENEAEYRELAGKQQAELIKKQNEEASKRPVRLADFQCIICMDNPTDLTVTHCGHLFCSECLHQALHAGDKKSCPVCRTIINTTLVKGRMPKNGIFPLEMKLVTATRKGKRAAK